MARPSTAFGFSRLNVAQCLDELGPGTGLTLGTFNRYDEEVKRPYSHEYSAVVEHQIATRQHAQMDHVGHHVRRHPEGDDRERELDDSVLGPGSAGPRSA